MAEYPKNSYKTSSNINNSIEVYNSKTHKITDGHYSHGVLNFPEKLRFHKARNFDFQVLDFRKTTTKYFKLLVIGIYVSITPFSFSFIIRYTSLF